MTLPFLLTDLARTGFYPVQSVTGAEVPWLPMPETAGGGWIVVLCGIVVGWTLVSTSVGPINALVGRIDENIGDLRISAIEHRVGLTRRESGAIRSAWWWVLPPGLGITLLVVAFFSISRGIEDITNPVLKR